MGKQGVSGVTPSVSVILRVVVISKPGQCAVVNDDGTCTPDKRKRVIVCKACGSCAT